MAAAEGRLLGEYMLGPRIGTGSFSEVWLARHRRTGEEVAVKEIRKTQLSKKVRDSLMKEITILSNVSHANIVRLHHAIQTEDHIFLVLEYCTGGDLAAYLRRHRRVSQAVARHLMRQLASGLKVLRDNNLIHRDLKPQNLLLSTNDETAVLKIGDFGFARYLMPERLAATQCGSPLYMAPEIIENKKYDAKADLWSVGAILFQLVTGRPPFNGQTEFELFQNILKSNELQFPQDILAALPPDCINLCRSLLRRNPVERLAFEDFFNHKFLSVPGTSESNPDSMHNTNNLGKGLDGDSLKSLHVRSMKTGSMDKGLLNKSALKVSDSWESIEREYVLVNAFASMETLPSLLETSLPENSSPGFPSYMQKKVDKGTADLMRTRELVVSSVCAEESMSNFSAPLSISRASASEKMHGTSSLHPSTRLQLLYQYVYTLTGLAQEKLNIGLHLESFSIELVILATWKEALRVCNSWMATTAEVDAPNNSAPNSPFIDRDDRSPVNIEQEVDFRRPLSVCSWAEQGFVAACDRAEKISKSFDVIKGNMEMPDAMEIIFQAALSAGRDGAVNELMGRGNRAASLYSRAIAFLQFIMEVASSLQMKSPFVVSPAAQQWICKYIRHLRARLVQSQMQELPMKQTNDSSSK